MEIKTTDEIQETCGTLSVVCEKSCIGCNNNKKWVAVEDIVKLFNDDSILCFEDLKDIMLSELTKEAGE